MSANSMHVVGNLVADPTLRYTTGGRPVVNFRIGINERINVNGEWRDRSNFANVVAWSDLALNVAHSLQQGDRVMVDGRYDTRDYVDADGVKQYRTEIIATEVGAALRFHTVGEIEKSVETKGTGEPADRTDPLPAPAGVGVGANGDEEPF